MKLEKRVAAFNTTAWGHPAEDAWALDSFVHNGQTVVAGCVSDGCSGDIEDADYQPELGAVWLSNQFVAVAQQLYVQGLRGEELGKTIVLRLGTAMRDYQPQSMRSKWCQDGVYRYSDELIATVVGFIADDENLVQVFGGDGYFMVNGKLTKLKETGIYPVALLQHSEDCWPETLSTVFDITVTDMSDVRTFVVATDGISGESDIQQWMKNWGRRSHRASAGSDVLVTGLSGIGPPKGMRDDITVVAFSAIRQ